MKNTTSSSIRVKYTLNGEDKEEDIYADLFLDTIEDLPEGTQWEAIGYEDFPDLGKHPDPDMVDDIARAMKTYGDAVLAYLEWTNSPWDEDHFEECYAGEGMSKVDYAKDYFNECFSADIPESIKNYIDYEKFAEYLFDDDMVVTVYEDNNYFWRNL